MTFYAGRGPSPDDLNRLIPLFAYKTGDEPLASNTTLQDDDQLAIAVDANASYWVTSFISYEAATAGDLKIGWSGPSGATFVWNVAGMASTAATAADPFYSGVNTIGGTDTVGGIGAGSAVACRPSGVLVTASTAGTFTFRWAQGTSSVTSTIVKTGSGLLLLRVA